MLYFKRRIVMVRKLITIGIVLISFLFQDLGISDIVIKDAYAQTKTGTVKKPAVEKKKAEKAQPQKQDGFSFEVKEFPDGVIGKRYNFVLAPKEATPPYKVTVVKGSLPTGITVNQRTGGIEGEPAQAGAWPLTLSLTDAKGKKGIFAGSVKVWRVLTVGEHGKFKGIEGLQMALNMAQDMDEMRIEKGIISGSGLVIPSNKTWAHGIKISGGWDEIFEGKSINPEDTVLDGGGKESRILEIGNSAGIVSVENMKFTNSERGAVEISGGSAVFTNCTFTSNSAKYGGGAVSGNGTFINCTFTSNSVSTGDGGAVNGGGLFTNCTFTSNAASGRGGAVSGRGTFTNCTFTSNAASGSGGAVSGNGTFTNCTLYGNLAKDVGGAVFGGGEIINSIFYKNTAGRKDNDISVRGNLKIDFSLVNYMSGAADFGADNIMGDPKFIDPDNGDLHLRPDSPAINVGKIAPEINKHPVDLDGKPRIVGGKIDMGAYEWDGKLTKPTIGLTGVSALAAGGAHNVALKKDGTVWAWGSNSDGQLGDGTTINRSTPVQISGLTGVSTIAAAYSPHTVALMKDGTVWAWGANRFGNLGDGTTINRSTPVQISELTNISAIAAADWNSIVL